MPGRISWLGRAVCAAVVCVSLASAASADVFAEGTANEFSIDFVTISGATNPTSGYGIVNNDYRIGVYEITNDQWNKFEDEYGTVTGSPSNAYDDGRHGEMNEPTTKVSWYEAAQFVNWLNTSTGHQAAYKFTGTQGTSGYALDTWDAGDADGTNIYRHKDAFYYLPTEDEWVKAGYWNGTDLQTWANASPDDLDSGGGPYSDKWNYLSTRGPWDVGSGAEELNGTFDMMGNVWEWMESPNISDKYVTDAARGMRGGSCADGHDSHLKSSYRNYYHPYQEDVSVGFRVASEVPEPFTLGLLSLGGLGLLARRRR